MTIVSVKSQSLAAGDQPTEGMAVKLTDATGAPVAGEALTWIASNGGSVLHSSSVTDATGVGVALWTLGPTTATQTLTVSNTRVATSAVFTGTVPIGTISFAANTTKYYVGDTLAIAATIKDTKGTTLTGLPTMVLRDTLIAAQSSSGSIIGKGDGITYAVVTTGPLNTPRDSVKLDVYRSLHGAVWTYDDSPLPAVRAYSTNGGVTDSSDVSPSGTYKIKLTAHTSGWASEVLIDAVTKSGRTFFPALIPVATDCSARALPNCVGSDINADVSFILVPTQYTVKRGVYNGRTLAVDLNSAMVTSVHTGPSFLNTSGVFQATITAGGKAPKLQNLYAATEQFWLPDSFPIGVALHRGCCASRAIVADDSVQLMRALNTIQNTLGYKIWTPINDRADFTTDRTLAPDRVLLFQFDSTMPAAVSGGGGTGPLLGTGRAPAQLMAQDFVMTGWRNSATDHITMDNNMSQSQAIVWNPNQVGSLPQNILMHEAMHTLGAGHGCQWASTQSYCGLDAPDTMPSFQDAAYLLLAMDVKVAAYKHRALHGLTAALFGQRAIVLGTDPVPAAWTLPEPGTLSPANDVSPASRVRAGLHWP
jgi:hypothetical protein